MLFKKEKKTKKGQFLDPQRSVLLEFEAVRALNGATVSFKELLTFNPAIVILACTSSADVAQTYLQCGQRTAEMQKRPDRNRRPRASRRGISYWGTRRGKEKTGHIKWTYYVTKSRRVSGATRWLGLVSSSTSLFKNAWIKYSKNTSSSGYKQLTIYRTHVIHLSHCTYCC